MKVELFVAIDKYEGDESHVLKINGEQVDSIYNLAECPEDARIGRDLIDGRDIYEYIKMGYEAGKAGEELIFEELKGDGEDEDA
jgi:hypothetical protein